MKTPGEAPLGDSVAGRIVPFLAGTTGPSRRRLPPEAISSFVGRDGEIARLRELLARPDLRLLVLLGPGGVGKTRIARRLAAVLADERAFGDGVAWVDLAPVDGPELVPPAIASVLGLHETGPLDPAERVRAYLRSRQVLVVLDNVEHLLGAMPTVASLLTSCPRLSVLATSRERLGIDGEHRFLVDPLPLPSTAATMFDSPAVRLFVDRATDVDPRFALTEMSAGTVAAICRRLDGLPLAIELAAARLGVLAPSELLERLDRRLPVLTGGPRDAPTRQRTLARAIAWSYDLLAGDEQTMFRTLAVFVGSFTLEAAERIAGPALETAVVGAVPTVLDLVGSLVDKSLVRREPGAAVPIRFTMLETVREFALERWAEAGDGVGARERHARWYLSVAESAEAALGGSAQKAFLDLLETEHGNLRAALAWGVEGAAVDDARAEIALRLAAALWRFWEMRGHLAEGRRWMERALAVGRGSPSGAQAKLLKNLGNVMLDLSAFEEAGACYDAALAIAEAVGDDDVAAATLNNLGLLASVRGDLTGARAFYQASLARARAANNASSVGISLANLAEVLNALGDHARAQSLLEESLAIRTAVDDRRGIAYSLNALGEVALARENLEAARRLLRQSLAIFREIGSGRGIGFALNNLGRAELAVGDRAAAVAAHAEALAVRHDLGDRRGTGESAEGVAVAIAATNPGAAARVLGAAAAIRSSLGVPSHALDRARLVRATATVRAALDAGAFSNAMAVGAAMSSRALVEAVTGLTAEVEAEAVPKPLPLGPPIQKPDRLTQREADVLRLLSEGRSNPEIAAALSIGRRTVASHVEAILRKLEVGSRAAAAAEATRRGLV